MSVASVAIGVGVAAGVGIGAYAWQQSSLHGVKERASDTESHAAHQDAEGDAGGARATRRELPGAFGRNVGGLGATGLTLGTLGLAGSAVTAFAYGMSSTPVPVPAKVGIFAGASAALLGASIASAIKGWD